jgi:hypothetical protein
LRTLERGLYEWSRLGFNEFVGFPVAWNMWLNAIVILSFGGIQATVMLSYVLGPRTAWIVDSRWVLGGVTLIVRASLIAIALIGLRLGKKVQDFGGAPTSPDLSARVQRPQGAESRDLHFPLAAEPFAVAFALPP